MKNIKKNIVIKYKAFLIRSLEMKFKDSFFGLMWLIIQPLILTIIYVLVISVLFNIKFSDSNSILSFAAYVLTGQITWNFVTQSMIKSSDLLKTNVDFVKNINFSLFIFPFALLIEVSIQVIVIFFVILAIMFFENKISMSIILFPFYFLILFLLCFSFSVILMVIGLFMRDLNNILTIFFGLCFYFTPVVMKEEFVPELLWKIIEFNPFSNLIYFLRNIFYGVIDIYSLFSMILISFCFLGLSVLFLKNFKPKVLDLL